MISMNTESVYRYYIIFIKKKLAITNNKFYVTKEQVKYSECPIFQNQTGFKG